MNNLVNSLLFFSLIGSGLVTGMFFAFSNFIMKAFSKVTHSNGLAAMQAINRAVLNPWFFLFFLGTAITTFILMVFYFFTSERTLWMLYGSLFYFFGCFVVTGMKNVPLNNQLEKLNATDEKSEQIWIHYIKSWTFWNHVRTAASSISFLCFVLALSK